MKHSQKMTVTLSMIWIGAMALASTPEWIRAARDFITTRSGGAPAAKGGGGGGRLS